MAGFVLAAAPRKRSRREHSRAEQTNGYGAQCERTRSGEGLGKDEVQVAWTNAGEKGPRGNRTGPGIASEVVPIWTNECVRGDVKTDFEINCPGRE